MKKAKRVLIYLLSVLMIAGFIPVTYANAETTNYVRYEDASDGDLLYTLNFNFDENFETGCAGVTDNTYTVSGDNGERVTFTNATTGGYFYGGKLSGYPIKGNIYTVSYYVENSSYSTIKTGATFFENAIDESTERVGIANAAAEDGQMHVFRGSSLYEKLDNTVIRKTDTSNNNRQYFKVVIDGVHGVAQFYALSDSDKYEWLVYIDMDMNAIAEDYLQIGMYICDAVSAEQAVSMGDVQIYKGNTVVTEKTAYQALYDSKSDGDVLYDVKFVDGSTSGVYVDGWNAFIGNVTGNGTVTASEDGNSLTLKKNSKDSELYVTAAMPDKSAGWYGSFTYEFYIESSGGTKGSRIGTWFLGNTAGVDNYRMGFSYFNNQYPGKVFMINHLWRPIAEYETPTLVNPDIFRGDAVVEASYVDGDTTYQMPDTGENITCNVKVEFDAVNKKMTTYMLKSGAWIKYASLYYDGTTFYPVFGVRNYNKNTTTVVRDFVVKKGLTVDTSIEDSSGPEATYGLSVDWMAGKNGSNTVYYPTGHYIMNGKSFENYPRTMEAWVNLEGDSYSSQSYIYHYLSAAKNSVKLSFKNGIPTFGYGGTSWQITDVTVQPDTWTHIAFTYGVGNEGNQIQCYINGILVATFTSDTKLEAPTDTGNLPGYMYLAGAAGTSASGSFNRNALHGLLGDVVMYTDVRSAEEIQADMQSVDTNDAELLAYYKLSDKLTEEIKEKGIPDASGNGYNITYGKTWLTEEELNELKGNDSNEYAYSLAVLPDLQSLTKYNPQSYTPIFDYLLENEDAKKIAYVLEVGDMTWDSVEREWTLVKAQHERLNNKVPYSLVRGDHDTVSTINATFAGEEDYYYQHVAQNGGFLDEDSIVDTYLLFSAGNTDYIILNLDFNHSDAQYEWASDLLTRYFNRRAIIVTHSYLDINLSRTVAGEPLWDNLVKKHANVAMVVSGHSPSDNIVYRVDEGDNGNKVYQLLVNTQASDNVLDGLGMVALMHFTEDGENISVEFYSTVYDKYYREHNYFTLSYDCYDSPSDGDHICDYCKDQTNTMTVCVDSNQDHICDTDSTCTAYTAGNYTHADSTDEDHLCDYCGKGIKGAQCMDVAGDNDHKCDVCGAEEITECSDADDNDHNCDECGAEGITECTDFAGDSDHKCDECGAEGITECADSAGDSDHKCDECGAEDITECADADDDNDHYCDECGISVKGPDCTDAASDNNHKCDVCGVDGITSCVDYVEDGDHKCDECGEIFRFIVDYSDINGTVTTGYLGGLRYDGPADAKTYQRKFYKDSSIIPITNRKYEITYWTEESTYCSAAVSMVYGKRLSNSSDGRYGWRTGKNMTTMVFYYNAKDSATITTPERDVIDGKQFFKVEVDGINKVMKLYVLSGGEYKLADEQTFYAMSYLQFGIHNANKIAAGQYMAVGDLTVVAQCTDADGDHKCDECKVEMKELHVDENGDCSCDVETCKKVSHTPNEDDGDCTTAITCSVCGNVTT